MRPPSPPFSPSMPFPPPVRSFPAWDGREGGREGSSFFMKRGCVLLLACSPFLLLLPPPPADCAHTHPPSHPPILRCTHTLFSIAGAGGENTQGKPFPSHISPTQADCLKNVCSRNKSENEYEITVQNILYLQCKGECPYFPRNILHFKISHFLWPPYI